MSFKVGDKVVCHNNSDQGLTSPPLVLNKVYVVDSVSQYFISVEKNPHKYLSSRFRAFGPADMIADLLPCNDGGKQTQQGPQPITSKLTLPVDSNERKNFPLFSGVLRYFPAALAGVARISKIGNDKHNPGQELHHARDKSNDHADCVIRHFLDLTDLLAARERGNTPITDQQILDEVSSIVWRALAVSQELHEKFGAPFAPGAKK